MGEMFDSVVDRGKGLMIMAYAVGKRRHPIEWLVEAVEMTASDWKGINADAKAMLSRNDVKHLDAYFEKLEKENK